MSQDLQNRSVPEPTVEISDIPHDLEQEPLANFRGTGRFLQVFNRNFFISLIATIILIGGLAVILYLMAAPDPLSLSTGNSWNNESFVNKDGGRRDFSLPKSMSTSSSTTGYAVPDMMATTIGPSKTKLATLLQNSSITIANRTESKHNGTCPPVEDLTIYYSSETQFWYCVPGAMCETEFYDREWHCTWCKNDFASGNFTYQVASMLWMGSAGNRKPVDTFKQHCQADCFQSQTFRACALHLANNPSVQRYDFLRHPRLNRTIRTLELARTCRYCPKVVDSTRFPKVEKPYW